jgi:hypothetical protein
MVWEQQQQEGEERGDKRHTDDMRAMVVLHAT